MTLFLRIDPLVIALPTKLAGLHFASEKFGRLQWKDLLESPIRLARDGITVGHALAKAINVSIKVLESGQRPE